MLGPGLRLTGESGPPRARPPQSSALARRFSGSDLGGLEGEGAAYRVRGTLRPVRKPWPGGKRLGREPGVQEEAPADTAALGMGGMTTPPRDLCIFSSLQCRYCLEICTWEPRLGEGSGGSCPRPLTQGGPFYQEPPGVRAVLESAGFSSQPHHPGNCPPAESSLFPYHSKTADLGGGGAHPYSLCYYYLFFYSPHFRESYNIRAERDLQKHLV